MLEDERNPIPYPIMNYQETKDSNDLKNQVFVLVLMNLEKLKEITIILPISFEFEDLISRFNTVL